VYSLTRTCSQVISLSNKIVYLRKRAHRVLTQEGAHLSSVGVIKSYTYGNVLRSPQSE